MAVDRVMPEGAWSFDQDVADSFDDMLARSIPQYEIMRRVVVDAGSSFARPDTYVLDLGCSRGEALASFVAKLGTDCHYLGVDVSEPMLDAARRRFADSVAPVEVRSHDLRAGFPLGQREASVVLSVLTLQFVPIEHRQRVLRDAFHALVPGGALLLVEKVLGATADLDALMVDLYYARKREAGYSQEAIDRKRLSLEGVLVPVTARWNEELLRAAGFAEVDCLWRWANFAAWIAVRSA